VVLGQGNALRVQLTFVLRVWFVFVLLFVCFFATNTCAQVEINVSATVPVHKRVPRRREEQARKLVRKLAKNGLCLCVVCFVHFGQESATPSSSYLTSLLLSLSCSLSLALQ
jgi:hypothetical protein